MPPLPFEQFKKLRDQGLSLDQITRFSAGQVTPALSASVAVKANPAEHVFNPKVANSQFAKPTPTGVTKMQYAPGSGTSIGSQFVPALKDVGGDAVVKPFAQTGVSLFNAATAGKDLAQNGFKPSVKATQDLNKPRNLGVAGVIKPFSSAGSETPFDPQLKGVSDAAGAGFAMAGTLDALSSIPEQAAKLDARMGGQATKNALKAGADAASKDALDITRPVMNKKLAINTLKMSGKTTEPVLDEAGNILKPARPLGATEPGLLKSATANATPKDVDVANSVKDLVSKNNSPVKNITNINQEISRVSTREIEPALKANKTGIKLTNDSGGGVIDRLKAMEPNRMIKSDSSLKTTYDQVRELMLENIAKNSRDTRAIDSNSLWKARKAFDTAVEEQFGDAIYNPEKNSAVKQGVRDMREEVNNIIGENNSTFRPQIKRLNNMYSARDNVVENNYKLLTGQSGKIMTFVKSHPLATKIGGAIVGGGIGGAILDHTLK